MINWIASQFKKNPVAATGATVGVAILGYWGLKKIGIIGRKESGAQNLDTLNSEIASAKNQSYQNSSYASWAEGLQAAMIDLGTDEDSIYRIFGYMKNDTDVKKLIAAFGLRDYKIFGITSFKGGLESWLQEELDSSEMAKLNNILKSKGITIQF